MKELYSLLERNPNYKKNIYLLIAICHKKLNDISNAIKILSKAINMFPNYYDAYIYRGKLYVKIKRYDKSQFDFDIAINLCPEKGLGYIGKADCLRFMNKYEEAI